MRMINLLFANSQEVKGVSTTQVQINHWCGQAGRLKEVVIQFSDSSNHQPHLEEEVKRRAQGCIRHPKIVNIILGIKEIATSQ